MKLKFLCLSVIGIVLVGVLFFAHPLLKSEAQKNPEKLKKQEEAVKKLRENLTTSMFYDNLQLKEAEWNLENTDFGLNSTHMFFKNNSKDAKVVIFEYSSIEEAKDGYWRPAINQAIIESYNDYGDEGRIIKRVKGDFDHLEFRKGRFTVYIDCKKDEETAKRFARYASDAITQ